MIRIGLAGLGFMGHTHLMNYLKYPHAQVVALADLRENRRKGNRPAIQILPDTQFDSADLGDVRSYETFEALCEEDNIDVISVCLPTDLHAESVVRALEAGKHVFCEKPMALDLESGQRMIDAARASDRLLMIGHVLRFWPEYVAVDKILRSDNYGRVLSASFHRASGAPAWADWFRSQERSGGVVVDLHIHDADLAVWWWGRPDRIDAYAATCRGLPCVSHSHWRYDDGPDILFQAAWEPAGTVPFHFGFKITLEDATIVLDSRDPEGLVLATREKARTIKVDTATAYEIEDFYFLDCVREGRPVEQCPPEESLLTLDCVLEESRQLRESR